MEPAEVLDLINTLPEDKQAEVVDFIKFLEYQITKERIIASDKETRRTFNSVDGLMTAIDNAD